MIRLTRLNNRPLVVNSDLIKFIENTPDTVITLITGEKVVVSETVEDVLDQIANFRRRVLAHEVEVSALEEPCGQPAEPAE